MRTLGDALLKLGIFLIIMIVTFLAMALLAVGAICLLALAIVVLPVGAAWAAVYGPDRVDIGSERIH